jgi:hypothetical protein
MKIFTLRHWAFLFLLLLAGPAWAQPAWQWASGGSSSGSNGFSVAIATAKDGAGNTVIAGLFYGTVALGSTTLVSAGGYDIFVARVSPTGQWLQAVRAGGAEDEYVSSLTVDGTGVVTIAGLFGQYPNAPGITATFGAIVLTNVGNPDGFVARLSPAGTWTQAVRVGTATTAGYTYINTLSTDSQGNAVITGTFAGAPLTIGSTTLPNGLGQDLFVARLNAAGQWSQVIQAGGPAVRGSLYSGATQFDAAGNLVVTGYFMNTFRFGATVPITSSGDYDVFVARLSPTGQWLQAVRAGGPGADYARCLGLDGAGGVVVGGSIGGTYASNTATFGSTTLNSLRSGDAFVARLNAAGQWTQAVSANGANDEEITALAVDAANNIIVAGYFGVDNTPFSSGGTIAFGTTSLTSFGQADGFVARLNPAGQWTQVLQVGGQLDDNCATMVLDASGAVTIAGGFTSSARFGPLTLNSPNSLTAPYVARLTGFAIPTAARTATPAEVFTLAPNPATGAVRLTWPEASAAARPVQVLDGLGREVRRLELPARATSVVLDGQGLAPGLYVVRCGAATGKLVME